MALSIPINEFISLIIRISIGLLQTAIYQSGADLQAVTCTRRYWQTQYDALIVRPLNDRPLAKY